MVDRCVVVGEVQVPLPGCILKEAVLKRGKLMEAFKACVEKGAVQRIRLTACIEKEESEVE